MTTPPNKKWRATADKKVIEKLTIESKVVDLADFKALLKKEQNNTLTEAEASTLHYWRYSTIK